jgi:hypothetical protein
MSSLKKLLSIGIVAAVSAVIFASIASVASACSHAYAWFNASPEINHCPTHRPSRTAALANGLLKAIRGPILGSNCYVGSRLSTQMKFRRDGGFDGFTGVAEQAEPGLDRVVRRCVDSTKGGRYVTPVAVHGHCCA